MSKSKKMEKLQKMKTYFILNYMEWMLDPNAY